MYEYHGWANIRLTPGEIEEIEEKKLWEIVSSFKKLIDNFANYSNMSGLKTINGQHLAWFAGCSNHGSSESEELLNIFRLIANKTPGSFGILYVWNTEESEELSNEFQVWRLTRGKFELLKDQYLSPCVPTIEDPM
jgi:hypothetical protein